MRDSLLLTMFGGIHLPYLPRHEEPHLLFRRLGKSSLNVVGQVTNSLWLLISQA